MAARFSEDINANADQLPSVRVARSRAGHRMRSRSARVMVSFSSRSRPASSITMAVMSLVMEAMGHRVFVLAVDDVALAVQDDGRGRARRPEVASEAGVFQELAA